jgi:hypothetical protein
MGLLSILLSALAVVCAGVGVLTTPIPKLGLVFAFGAPALALAGIMLGGSAMSKAKRGGETSETGRLGAILSAIAFVPSVVVALTCGVCNAFFSTGDMRVQRNFHFGAQPFGPDGGVFTLPAPQRLRPQPDPNAPQDSQHQPEPPPPSPLQPVNPSHNPGQNPAQNPPPEQTPGDAPLPPPPLPPGPRK